MNAVVYDSQVAIRYEDTIERLQVWNCTIGAGVQRPFMAASSRRDGLDVRNVLILAPSLPPEAQGASNQAAAADEFVNAAGHDYRLRATSRGVDAGVRIPEVTHDRAGISRPQGRAYDIGAYELAEDRGRAGSL
jgi:hypothetical protein